MYDCNVFIVEATAGKLRFGRMSLQRNMETTHKIWIEGDPGVVASRIFLDLRLRGLRHVRGPRLLELLLAFLVGGLDGKLSGEDIAKLRTVPVATTGHL
jgi:hypothetical protein